MVNFKYFVQIILVSATLCSSLTIQAALIDRGNGLIYDDVLDITWLQDAGLVSDSGFHVFLTLFSTLD